MSVEEPITVPMRAGRAVTVSAPVGWLCFVVRAATLLYAALAAAVLALAPIYPEWLFGEAARTLDVTLRDLPFGQMVAAVLTIGVGIVASVLMMLSLNRMFAGFAAGRVFGAETSRHLRTAATWAVVGLVTDIAARPLISLLLTIDRGPGHRTLMLGVGSHDLVNLIFAGTMLAMAHVLAQAGRIADDNATIV
jgi:hypothetical protein